MDAKDAVQHKHQTSDTTKLAQKKGISLTKKLKRCMHFFFFFFFFFLETVLGLVGRGFVINEAYLVLFILVYSSIVLIELR